MMLSTLVLAFVAPLPIARAAQAVALSSGGEASLQTAPPEGSVPVAGEVSRHTAPLEGSNLQAGLVELSQRGSVSDCGNPSHLTETYIECAFNSIHREAHEVFEAANYGQTVAHEAMKRPGDTATSVAVYAELVKIRSEAEDVKHETAKLRSKLNDLSTGMSEVDKSDNEGGEKRDALSIEVVDQHFEKMMKQAMQIAAAVKVGKHKALKALHRQKNGRPTVHTLARVKQELNKIDHETDDTLVIASAFSKDMVGPSSSASLMRREAGQTSKEAPASKDD